MPHQVNVVARHQECLGVLLLEMEIHFVPEDNDDNDHDLMIMIIHDETRSNLSAEIFNLVLLEFLAPKRSIRRANVVSLFVSQSALCF